MVREAEETEIDNICNAILVRDRESWRESVVEMDTKATAAAATNNNNMPMTTKSFVTAYATWLLHNRLLETTYIKLPRSIGVHDTCQVVPRDPPASSPGAIGYKGDDG